MNDEHENRGRRSIRLPHFDYSSEGGYFITICTDQHRALFGKVIDGGVTLTKLGQVLSDEWQMTPMLRPEIVCDEFVIMPNHFHAILFIQEITNKPDKTQETRPLVHCNAPVIHEPRTRVGAHGNAPVIHELRTRVGAHGNAPCYRQPRSISSFVSGLKGSVTRASRAISGSTESVVWQRNYYEHIIRNEADLAEKREYIRNNPLKWELDEYHVE